MRLIVVDIGNSGIKWRRLPASPQARAEPPIRIDNFDQFYQGLPESPCAWFIASVQPRQQQRLLDELTRHRPDDSLNVITHDHVPLGNNTQMPTQVGIDRLLAGLAAHRRDPETCQIVVDSGTAVTIDLVDEQGVFQGGHIYPGLATDFSNLAAKAAALPELDYGSRRSWLQQHERSESTTLLSNLGRNTHEAILLGIYRAQWGAIEFLTGRLIEDLKSAQRRAQVVLTGGGIDELVAAQRAGLLGANHPLGQLQTANPTFHWVPDLVLSGVEQVARSLPPKNR